MQAISSQVWMIEWEPHISNETFYVLLFYTPLSSLHHASSIHSSSLHALLPSPPPQPTLNPPSTPLSPFLFLSPHTFSPSLLVGSGTCLAINEIVPHALCLLQPPLHFFVLLSPLLLFFSTHAILPRLSMAFLSAQCTGNFSAQSGNYRVSYVVQGNNVTFSVSARTTGWVAIGVSNDNRMVSYVFCRHIIKLFHF